MARLRKIIKYKTQLYTGYLSSPYGHQ